MQKVKITFKEEIEYYVETEVSDETYEQIKDLDYDDVSAYILIRNGLRLNPLYDTIQQHATDRNVVDNGSELLDVTVTKLNNE